MPDIEDLLKTVPLVRRPFFQRDHARHELRTVIAELAAAKRELEITKRDLEAVRAQSPWPLGWPLEKVKQTEQNKLWFIGPNDDARQDELIGDFRFYIGKAVDKNSLSLEIGPSHNPILPKSDGYKVLIFDHLNQAGLIEKYTTHGIDTAKIESVDYVSHGDSLGDLVGNRRFDAIVASHVIEHIPDFIRFLRDCSGALNDHAKIFFLVPDKRFCFDFFQPVTDVAKIIADYRLARTRHSFESFYRMAARVNSDSAIAWGQQGIADLTFPHGDPKEILSWAEALLNSDKYQDNHENYFTPMSFSVIIQELRYLREIDLELHVLTRPRGCEFLAVLKKNTLFKDWTSEDYLRSKLQAYLLLITEDLERAASARRLFDTVFA